jgi:LysM repeat protein
MIAPEDSLPQSDALHFAKHSVKTPFCQAELCARRPTILELTKSLRIRGRMASNESLYLVQPGDTLMNIALHFDISIPWLRETNPHVDVDLLLPGDELSILPEPVQTSSPIPVSLFFPDQPRDMSRHGHLLLLDTSLRFEHPPERPIVIDLTTYIRSVVIFHPLVDVTCPVTDDTPFLFLVSHLSDPSNPASLSLAYFCGHKAP